MPKNVFRDLTLKWGTVSQRPPNASPFAETCHLTNGISIGSAVFAQMIAECPYTLQWDAPFHLKIAPFYGGIWTPIWHMFLWLTRVLNPNGISIGRDVFAGLTGVTDRQTDRQTDRPRYSVGNNRPHLLTNTAMRPKNNVPYAQLQLSQTNRETR